MTAGVVVAAEPWVSGGRRIAATGMVYGVGGLAQRGKRVAAVVVIMRVLDGHRRTANVMGVVVRRRFAAAALTGRARP